MPLTKVKANDTRLPIMTGRQENANGEERFCMKNISNAMGVGFHIMLLCPYKNNGELHNRYFPSYQRYYLSLSKFNVVMQAKM